MFKKAATAQSAAPAMSADTLAPAIATDAPTVAAPAWSEDDEAAYQELLARRRTAKVRRASGATVRLGDDAVLVVGPTPAEGKSVMSTIRAVVAVHGEAGVVRSVLLAELGSAKFESAAAKPTDPGWLKGWVAGAFRQGVLAIKSA